MMGWKIVSRPDCKWCRRAKAHLAVRGVEFEEEHLATREEQLAFKDRTGADTFPQVWDGDTHVGGFDALRKYLA
jgi:glutaredoxin